MNRQTEKSEPIPAVWLTIPLVTYVLFFLAEFTYKKHPYVSYEQWFGFFEFAGLIGAIALSVLALLLRPLLWRDREYYDG